MPQVFRISGFLVYFWSNEGDPLEPVHFHVTDGAPSQNATKVWMTKSGHCLLCDKGNIPDAKLRKIMEIAEARHQTIIDKWYDFFGEITYYC